ncbi:MAG: hypothetical protein SWN10_20295 [Pseudomonadota bacterium]|nr:hypothetical protein [Pseudomonadota bacterium]
MLTARIYASQGPLLSAVIGCLMVMKSALTPAIAQSLQPVDLKEAINEGVTGINFFYLDGRDQEGLPQLMQKLALGDSACKGTREGINKRFHATLTELKSAGYNWVRVLVGQGFYQIYSSRCNIPMSQVYPVLSPNQAAILNTLLEGITGYGFTLELVLGGSAKFSDTQGDIRFFESILTQIDLSNVGLVMLGGDVQPTRSKKHKDWLLMLYRHFTQHTSPELRQLNYSFDTVTYPQIAHFESYLKWVKQSMPSLPVVSINLYNRSLPAGAKWYQYYEAIQPYLKAYDSSGLTQSPWIDEYGFRLSNPPEQTHFTEDDQLAYVKGLTYAIYCNSTTPIPAFIWTAGNDRYLADPSRDLERTPYGLFRSYANNTPVPTKAFNWIKEFHTDTSACKALEQEFDTARATHQ